MIAVAAGAVAIGVLLGFPARPRIGVAPAGAGRRVAFGSLVATALGVVLAGPLAAAPATIALGAALGVGALWRRRGARRAAVVTAERVAEVCDLLGAELAAGRPPGVALARAAREWPPLGPVAEAFALGADVPGALRTAARAPGAADLRLLGAAWEVAHRAGSGLAPAVEAVAEDLRAARTTRRVVDSELASARATARLVAVLPVPALLMGAGAGGDPWGFLLGTPVGLASLALGVGFAVAGLWWIESIAAGVWRVV